jgi:hypothetical protein
VRAIAPAVLLLFALALALAMAAAAQVSQRPVDAVVPVVGSTSGAFGARFRTEMQLNNAGTVRASGWLILRPQGSAVPPGGTVLPYDLAPHATLSFDDVLTSFGFTGLGSLDILVDRGELPIVVARAYDDQDGKTTGVTVPLVPYTEVLTRNDVSALIVPRDLTRYRFNIGARSLGGGATVDVIVRNAAGAERHRRTLVLGENEFLQQPGDTFAGIALQPNDSIEVRVVAGTSIVYGTTVDNATNDSSFQLLRRR